MPLDRLLEMQSSRDRIYRPDAIRPIHNPSFPSQRDHTDWPPPQDSIHSSSRLQSSTRTYHGNVHDDSDAHWASGPPDWATLQRSQSNRPPLPNLYTAPNRHLPEISHARLPRPLPRPPFELPLYANRTHAVVPDARSFPAVGSHPDIPGSVYYSDIEYTTEFVEDFPGTLHGDQSGRVHQPLSARLGGSPIPLKATTPSVTQHNSNYTANQELDVLRQRRIPAHRDMGRHEFQGESSRVAQLPVEYSTHLGMHIGREPGHQRKGGVLNSPHSSFQENHHQRPVSGSRRVQGTSPFASSTRPPQATSGPHQVKDKVRSINRDSQPCMIVLTPDRTRPVPKAASDPAPLHEVGRSTAIVISGKSSSTTIEMYRQTNTRDKVEMIDRLVSGVLYDDPSRKPAGPTCRPKASSAVSPSDQKKTLISEQQVSIKKGTETPASLEIASRHPAATGRIVADDKDCMPAASNIGADDDLFGPDMSLDEWESYMEDIDRSTAKHDRTNLMLPPVVPNKEDGHDALLAGTAHTAIAAIPEFKQTDLAEQLTQGTSSRWQVDSSRRPSAPIANPITKLCTPSNRLAGEEKTTSSIANPVVIRQSKDQGKITTTDRIGATNKESKRKASDNDSASPATAPKRIRIERNPLLNQTQKAASPMNSEQPAHATKGKSPVLVIGPKEETSRPASKRTFFYKTIRKSLSELLRGAPPPKISKRPLPVLEITSLSTYVSATASAKGIRGRNAHGGQARGEDRLEDVIALAYRAISRMTAVTDQGTQIDSSSKQNEVVDIPIASELFGNAFIPSDSRLIIRDHSHLREVFASLVVTQEGPLQLDEKVISALEEIKSITFCVIPDLLEAGTLLFLAGQVYSDRPGTYLFPNLRHLYLKPAAQVGLISLLYEHYDSGIAFRYITALASIGSVTILCTDYNIRALESTFLRQCMELLRALWADLRIHHIHNVQDDLPWTMPAIEHHATWLPDSVPFKRRRWIDDDPPPSSKKQKTKFWEEEDELELKLSPEEKAGPTANRFQTWAEGLARVVGLDAVVTRRFLADMGHAVPNANDVCRLQRLQKEAKIGEANGQGTRVPETRWKLAIPTLRNDQGDADAYVAAMRGGAERLISIWQLARVRENMFGLDKLQHEDTLALLGEAIQGTNYQHLVQASCEGCGWSP